MNERRPHAWEIGEIALFLMEAWPKRWYATCHRDGDNRGNVWTLSPSPDEVGWENDGDEPGYGLPRAIAERLASILNTRRSIGRIVGHWLHPSGTDLWLDLREPGSVGWLVEQLAAMGIVER